MLGLHPALRISSLVRQQNRRSVTRHSVVPGRHLVQRGGHVFATVPGWELGDGFRVELASRDPEALPLLAVAVRFVSQRVGFARRTGAAAEFRSGTERG